ncbi:MAG: hypothetical protein GY953_23595 [bacterium]|nr:hypothetical protein [bacterium]
MARPPTAAESELLRDALSRCLAEFKNDTEAANKQLSVGQSPRDLKIEPAELAAYTTVARMMLNLSEFITKG